MQLTLIQLKGRDIGRYEDTFSHILDLTERCCRTDTDLILLPECAYPGYFIGMAEDDAWIGRLLELKQKLSHLAGSYGKYIAVGLADSEEGKLYNRLLVYGRDGQTVCTADKSNLWHFDSEWFETGNVFPVFNTEFGPIGCMICADGRIPEIARCLRLQGARLILDTVNLVASAPVPEQLSNQQYTFILRQRARENGVYIAVCDKCGTEDHSVTMLGRSMVIGPDGQILAECGPEHEEILTCDIRLDTDTVPYADIPPRQPEYYSLLTAPTESLPVYRKRNHSCTLPRLEWYTGFVRYPFCTSKEYVEKALHYMKLCKKAGCRLVLLPYAQNMDLSPWLSELGSAAAQDMTVLAGYGVRRAVLFHHGICRQLKDTPIDQRTMEVSPELTISLIFDQEAEIPESMRICMLQGTDLAVWYDGTSSACSRQLMQTRSAENRIYTARLTAYGCQDRSFACTPDGTVLTTTFACEEQVVFGMIYTALSRCKTVVPGTDIVTSRVPAAYTLLTT